MIRLGEVTLWHGVGRRAEGDLARACAAHDWVVTSEPVPAGLGPPACRIIGPEDLAASGAVALQGPGLAPVTARALQGARPWVPGP